VTNVTHPGASPEERCDEQRSRRREWLEPVALEADAEDLVAVRVHERGGPEPIGPVHRDPALDALVGGHGSRVAMNLVEGLPAGGVGNAGFALPSAGSTVNPSRFT
jgi:hypothetical protein